MYILKKLLVVTIIILIVMSLLSLISVHWLLSQEDLSFSPKGIDYYLSTLGVYKNLYTATIATMAAYFGSDRLKAAIDANVQKQKQDRFTEWKSVLDIRFIEIDKQNPSMKREFAKKRRDFYEKLYLLDFNIKNKEQLTVLFNSIFRDLVDFFENQNIRHNEMGEIYPNDKYSYSFDSFRFLFLGCIDTQYEDILIDLENLYLSSLSVNRIINAVLYKKALENYRTVNR